MVLGSRGKSSPSIEDTEAIKDTTRILKSVMSELRDISKDLEDHIAERKKLREPTQ